MRPTIDTLKIKVPENIQENIAAKMQWDPPNWVKSRNVDKFLYIINKIITLSSSNRKYRRLKLVPLSSVVLRYELGKYYRKYIDWLIKHKFIESDNHYIVGNSDREGKCKCYGLTTTYKSKPLVDFELKNEFILKKILNWRKNKLSETVSDPMMARLYSMMDNFHVDIKGVTEELNQLKKEGIVSQKQMDIEIAKCQKINDKSEDTVDLFIVKDDYSRVHTNITNLSRRVRENHLYIGQKKAVGIDIVSSQPALLHSLFQDYINRIEKLPENVKKSDFYIEFGDVRTDVREKYRNKRNFYDGQVIYDPESEISLSKLGFSNFNECLENLNKEISYLEQSLLGMGIYEFFLDRWNEVNEGDVSRSDIKTLWMGYVFGSGDENKMSSKVKNISKIWKICFPTLDKLLNYFKEGDYKLLSHNLQRKEADLIYNKLCPRVEKEFGINFSTVHDSIIVEESVTEIVSNLFDEILEENNICTITNAY